MNTTVIGKNVTFRAHAADASHLRNSKVIDIIAELGSSGIEVTVHDPEADAREAMHEYGVQLARWDELPRADAIVAAVAHRSYHELSTEEICGKSVKGGSFIDVKAGFDKTSLIAAVMRVWRL